MKPSPDTMNAEALDPDAHIANSTKALQLCLCAEAQRLLEQDRLEQALVTLFRAYALKPGLTPILHSIAQVYQKLGDVEAAIACQRGVVPESAETQYFSAQFHARQIKISRKASNSHHLKTHRAESVTLDTPASNDQPRRRPEFRAVKTESRGSFVSVLKNGGVWFDGFNTLVTDAKQNILQEHIKGNPYVIADTSRQRAERYLNGTVCFLDARSSPIYYHWMMDVLPKFALLKQAGISIDSIDYFIVRCRSAFQTDTLERMGVPAARILDPWSEGTTRCENLVVPYLKHDRGDRFYSGLGLGMARWVPQWLQSVFLTSTPVRQKRLYLSRTARGTRCVTQEGKLVVALEQRGFACVTLENLSVSDQAALMAYAQIVVAPHGAGLSNIAFCQAGTTIVEIFGDYVVPCYWALSELTGLVYHAYFVDAQTIEHSLSPEQAHVRAATLIERRDQNIELDVDSLLTYIDPLLQSETTMTE